MALNITLNPGDSLYKYQLIRKIGGGNFGEVWLAHDVTISKEVAVKILDESMAPVAENLKEAQVGHLLEHQNVVHVHYADVVGISGVNVVIQLRNRAIKLTQSKVVHPARNIAPKL